MDGGLDLRSHVAGLLPRLGMGTVEALALTAEDVAERIEQAMRTLSRLPMSSRDTPRRGRMVWPTTLREMSEEFANAVDAGKWRAMKAPLPPPSNADIDNLHAVLGWLLWLRPEDRSLVMARGIKERWWRLERRYRDSRRTLKRRWMAAMILIASRA